MGLPVSFMLPVMNHRSILKSPYRDILKSHHLLVSAYANREKNHWLLGFGSLLSELLLLKILLDFLW